MDEGMDGSGITTAVISKTMPAAVRGVKSSLLYADSVVVVSGALAAAVGLHQLSSREVLEPLAAAVTDAKARGENPADAVERVITRTFEARPLLERSEWAQLARAVFADPDEGNALRELMVPGALGVVHVHRGYKLAVDALAGDPTILPLVSGDVDASAQAIKALETPRAARRGKEAAVAAQLLGALDGFPEASIDVILDVRDRLSPARARFVGAVSQAVAELEDADDSGAAIDHVVATLRRRTVLPAIEEINDELRALGVRETLLRAASDAKVVAPGLATLTLVAAGPAAGGGPVAAAIASALGSAATLAAAAKESLFRAERRRELSRKPYWLLADAQRNLSRAGPGR
jgi:hypothetical protein